MKMFQRTEDGTTTRVSISDGMAEVDRADSNFEELGIRSLSSKGSTHFIEYSDGRKVLLEVVEAPDAKPVSKKGRACLAFVRDAGRPVPVLKLSEAGFKGNTVNSIDGSLCFRPAPYIRRTPEGYILTDLGRLELDR
jgi:hypothetical protein